MDDTDSTFLVRSLSSSEWELYKKLRLLALKEEPQAFGRSFAEESAFSPTKWMERVQNPFNLVAFSEGKLVGMCSAFLSGSGEETVACITSVFVMKQFRGLGVGSALLATELKKLQQQNVKRIELTVNSEQTGAVGLYKKFGFEIVAEQIERLGDGMNHLEYLMRVYPTKNSRV